MAIPFLGTFHETCSVSELASVGWLRCRADVRGGHICTPRVPLRTLCWLIQAQRPPVPLLMLAGSQPGRLCCTRQAGHLAPVAPKAVVRSWGEPFLSESQPQLPQEDSQYPSSALRARVQISMGCKEPCLSYSWLEPQPAQSLAHGWWTAKTGRLRLRQEKGFLDINRAL